MKSAEIVTEESDWKLEYGDLCVGEIVSISSDGIPFVDFFGNSSGPVRARTVVTMEPPTGDGLEARPVLLGLEHGDPRRPMILGFLRDSIYRIAPNENAAAIREQVSLEVFADAKRVKIDATDEILLKCGKSSILLRRDGHIIIKGAEIVSRSSGTNKIKGASVAIN